MALCALLFVAFFLWLLFGFSVRGSGCIIGWQMREDVPQTGLWHSALFRVLMVLIGYSAQRVIFCDFVIVAPGIFVLISCPNSGPIGSTNELLGSLEFTPFVIPGDFV